jgi:hypothetical protein
MGLLLVVSYYLVIISIFSRVFLSTVIGLFSSSSPSSLQQAFADTARAMKHRLQFSRCIDCAALQNLLAVPSQDDVVIIYNRNASDFTEFHFSEKSDNSTLLSIQLRSFIHQYSLPVLITNPHDFIDDLKDNQMPVLKLFSDASTQKKIARERKYLEVLHQTMRDLRGKMVAVYYRNDSSRNSTELQELGVTGLKLPVVFIHDVGRYRLKYLFNSSYSISTVNLRSFIYNFFVGNLTRYYRSQEPISIDWASMFGSQSVQYQKERTMNYTVGLTFQRDILNSADSIVVLFCHPDVAACRHVRNCHRLDVQTDSHRIFSIRRPPNYCKRLLHICCSTTTRCDSGCLTPSPMISHPMWVLCIQS